MEKEDVFKWKPEYETGIHELDQEHRIFLTIIEKLNTAFTLNEDKAYIAMLLKELFKYVDFHFTSEENIMFKSKFPEYGLQKREHQNLLFRLTEIMSSYDVDYIDRQELIDFLLGWFQNHTTKMDMRLGKYLQSRERKG